MTVSFERMLSVVTFLIWPSPTYYLRLVNAVLVSVVTAVSLLITAAFQGLSPDSLKLRRPIDYIHRQAETIDLIVDGQFHRSIDVAFFLISTYVHVAVVGSTVSQPVNQPRVAMKIEDDWFVDRKQRVEIPIWQSMRMFCTRLQLEQVNDIDITDF